MPLPDRRAFLSASAALPLLPAVPAAAAALDPELVRLDSGIEPLVRLLEDTPRDRLVEEVATRIKAGLGYQEVLAALLLAGVRNVPPRPSVGFKFHAVLVVHSAHLASLAGPPTDRWLPVLWAVDNFKGSQAQTVKEGGWRMKPPAEGKVPPARKARAAFVAAMDNWDVEAADVAAAALARTAGAGELFDLFARYGSRDFRDIGHKAIYVANAFRALQVIGWHHAEPVLRSLAFALLHHDDGNPSTRDDPADRPGRRATELAGRFRDDWPGGKPNPEATAEVLELSRTGSDAELADFAMKRVNAGASQQAVWDGLFLAAGELLVRQPGIVGLHSLTTLNALRHAFDAASDDSLRRTLLLQAAAFVPLFRDAMKARGKLTDGRIDRLGGSGPAKLEAVFATLSKDRPAAAGLAADYLRADPGGADALIAAGRRLVFLKGTDSHDYKFSAAVAEDYRHLSPAARDQFLAASVCWLKGSAGADTPLVGRVRAGAG